jgi:hypothetical protein
MTMYFKWEPHIKHNHNTSDSARLEGAVVAAIGGTKPSNHYDAEVNGVLVEVCGQKPGASPNTKNRIDEKMGRVLRDTIDGLSDKFMIIFLGHDNKQTALAMAHSRDTPVMKWMFGTYDGEKYQFKFADGTPTELSKEEILNAF